MDIGEAVATGSADAHGGKLRFGASLKSNDRADGFTSFGLEGDALETISCRDSRAMSIFTALERLPQLLGTGRERDERFLCIHVLGADFVEAERGALEAFRPLLEHLQKAGSKVKHVRVALIGPNIPFNFNGKTLQAKLEKNGKWNIESESSTISNDSDTTGDVSINITMENNFYHDSLLRRAQLFRAPDAAFLFNAGIWGYESWIPTLDELRYEEVPTIITSYNVFEADDDQSVLEDSFEQGKVFRWLWGPELNPWRSHKGEPLDIAI